MIQEISNMEYSKKHQEISSINLVGPRPAFWWSDKKPIKLEALPPLDLTNCTREDILAYFKNGWLLNEILFSSLKGKEAFIQPPLHGLRHPMIFYYGHTATLFVNKLLVAKIISQPVNPYFERIFEVGVDEMSWDDMSKNEMQWPEVHDVTNYRHEVFNLVCHIINTSPDLGICPITQDSPLWALFMAMEHERIHLETSSVLIREMPLNLLQKPEIWLPLPLIESNQPIANKLVKIPAGEVMIGKKDHSYGWDNEFGLRHANFSTFEISQFLITNGEYLEFVKNHGYTTKELWTEAGWQWKCYRNTKKPTFWEYAGPEGLHTYKLRTLFELIDLPMDWPVCVNRHEAKAYLAWCSKKDGTTYRLPTEAEHLYLRQSTPDKNNTGLLYGSECSVTQSQPNGFGVSDIAGNLWDWCEDDFYPLEGFKVHDLYEDFSTPCFDGEHSMILGGSFISTGTETSQSARFHFRPHFHQHAGFHMVKSSTNNAIFLKKPSSKYDDTKVLDQYLLFHYGEDSVPKNLEHVGQFPQRCANILVEMAQKYGCGFNQVLDVGCAVGGASFELLKSYEQVTGVDISEQFIHTANNLKNGKDINYRMVVEGELYKDLVVKAPEVTNNIHFRRADACSLPSEYHSFDAVLASNLLCRLPSPKAFLSRLGGMLGLVKPGGIVVFASPYSWSEQYTQQTSWLGGYNSDNPQWSIDGLNKIMSSEFTLVHREDFPFMIREHRRKFEYVVSDLSVWIRNKN